MKVATFNVNSIRARLPIVIAWLLKNRPDVLAMQETKVQDDDFPADAFGRIGYSCVFHGQKSYNGVALASRHALADVQFGWPDGSTDEARLVKARVRNLVIVNTYVPQGYLAVSERFRYKLEWFSRLLDYWQTGFQPTDPILWVGDLNVAPLPIDVYDPVALLGHVCYHPQAREALARVMAWGFTDVFRLHCHEAGWYTYWDYRSGPSFRPAHGWRLDHIMATRTLAERCTACSIDREPRRAERPSDHTPVVAELDW